MESMEVEERRRRACSVESSDDSDEPDDEGRGAEDRDDSWLDYDEGVGVRASFDFCSQVDREQERDENDVASLQFESPTGVPVAKTLVPGRSVLKTSDCKRSRLKHPSSHTSKKKVTFDLPPLPTPYVPPHKKPGYTPHPQGYAVYDWED